MTERRRPLVVAHRGASGAAPENTLEAFELAITLGADMIEFDVRRTADGQLVVFHDPTIDGRPIGAVDAAELRGGEVGRALSGIEVPTLAETLARTKGRIGLDVELKEEGYEAEVVAQVHAQFGRDGVVFTSFSQASVAAIAALDPPVRAGLILDDQQENEIDFWRDFVARENRDPSVSDILAVVRGCGASLVAASRQLLARDDFEDAARAAGYPLYVWTVNERDQMTRFLEDPAVDALLTDHPDVALALRDARGEGDGGGGQGSGGDV